MTIFPRSTQVPMTHKHKKILYHTSFLLLAAIVLFTPLLANSADLFAGAKAQITESTNSDSTLWFAVTVAGLAGAALTGFFNQKLAVGYRGLLCRDHFHACRRISNWTGVIWMMNTRFIKSPTTLIRGGLSWGYPG
ncbi:hypothetical protein [Photobacterium leiognathi]|uniref:hypothetical protein n=1 Tax=Photobacterium leiognathi TaxID=553611 RepID=UPI002738DA07|nr:hypothetical protein [Photobacterium leiognathi]